MAATWTKEVLLEAIKSDPKFLSKCPAIAADIVAHRMSLITLIEHLKDLLTDPEPSQRALSLVVLSAVLKALPADFLQEDELHFVVTYFCERLKDHHGVVPSALKGILSILRMKNFSNDLPLQVLRSIVMNINCQTSPQQDRMIIYQILDLLLTPQIENLKHLGPDLVYHILSTIDSEQDPRNLKFIFLMMPPIIRQLPMGHLTEEVFEAMACYFPVDYNSPAHAPDQITREELASSLAECLTAVPQFANFCIPLLLEKMNTPLLVAKKDSLHLLLKACTEFTPADIAVHLSPIWMNLSREALNGADFVARTLAQDCVTHLLRCFSNLPLVNGQHSLPMMQLLGDVISASVSFLSQIHSITFIPATGLLLAAAESCSQVCKHILSKVMPQVVDSCSESQSSADRSVYLQVISRYLTVCKSLNVTPQSIPEIGTQWNLLVQLYFGSIDHEVSLLHKEALFGLTVLVPTLDHSDRLKLYNLLCKFVDKENSPEVREQTLLCLLECTKYYPTEVEQQIIKFGLQVVNLQTTDPRYKQRIEAHCFLAACESIGQDILSYIVNLITSLNDSAALLIVLAALRKLLEAVKQEDLFVVECLEHNIFFLNKFLLWWISCLASADEYVWVSDEEIINESCLIITSVMKNLTSEQQSPIVQHVLSYFFPGDHVKPLELSSPKHHNLAVILFEAFLASLHPDVQVPTCPEICCALTELAVGCHHSLVTTSASRLCANMLNKLPDVALLNEILDKLSRILDEAVAQSDVRKASQATHFYGWLIKGLAMRGYANLAVWIDQLTDLVGDTRAEVSMAAANAFETIMQENSRYLDHESHCVSRLFYKQRIFENGLQLVVKARERPCGKRVCYLHALSYLLMDVPTSVLASKFVEVAPLFLETFSQDSVTLLELALKTLDGLLQKPAVIDILKDYIQSLVPRLLQMVAYEHSMYIRRNAINCLCQISTFPTELLLPFKDEVTFGLLACLDDKKRLVRKDAVKARTSWLLVGAA